MTWSLSEYVLKGIYVGLLVFLALASPGTHGTLLAIGLPVAGLLAALGLAAVRKNRRGYQPRGNLLGSLGLALLDRPGLVYAGIIGGALVAAYLLRVPDRDAILFFCWAGGAVLGSALLFLAQPKNPWIRRGASLALAAGLAGSGLFCLS